MHNNKIPEMLSITQNNGIGIMTPRAVPSRTSLTLLMIAVGTKYRTSALPCSVPEA